MGMTLVGAGYRPQLQQLFNGSEPEAACVELIANKYFASDAGLIRGWELDQVAGLPVIVHGVSGNVASTMGPEKPYLEQIRRLADYTDAIVYSDHVAFTAAHGRALGHLAPNRFDDELLDCACRHIELMAEVTGRRVTLENLATKTTMAGSKYSPEEFYLRLLDESDGWDCLVDLTNIWINSQNRPVDPYEFIEAIPPNRVRYVHLAGGRWFQDELIDTHSQSVHPEVYPLLEFLLERAHPDAIIVERDSNWENAYTEVRANVASARAVVEASQDSSGNRRTKPVQASA
jgi:uncharacterized protein (UPF0276 family)